MVLKGVRYASEIAFQAVDTAKTLTVEGRAFLVQRKLIAHAGDQLRRARQQQPERQFEAGDVIHIQQGNTQTLFRSRPAGLTFRHHIGPLFREAFAFHRLRKAVFLNLVVNARAHR